MLVLEYLFTMIDYVFPCNKGMFNWTDSLHVAKIFWHITILVQLLKIFKDSAKLHLVLGVLDLQHSLHFMTMFFDLIANLGSFLLERGLS